MIEIVKRLSIDEQIRIVTELRQVCKQAPLFQKTMPTGQNFRYLCTSAGAWGWLSDKRGYRYEDRHPVTHDKFQTIPQSVMQAVEQAQPGFVPDSCLINWYQADGKLGLHQDNNEQDLSAPIVSISLGDDCIFQVGGLRRTDPVEKMILSSGDVLVMNAEHRMCFHGVAKIVPNTGPSNLLKTGRINLTLRKAK